MAKSSTVTNSDTGTAEQYNNVRLDAIYGQHAYVIRVCATRCYKGDSDEVYTELTDASAAFVTRFYADLNGATYKLHVGTDPEGGTTKFKLYNMTDSADVSGSEITTLVTSHTDLVSSSFVAPIGEKLYCLYEQHADDTALLVYTASLFAVEAS